MYVEKNVRRIGNSLGVIIPSEILKMMDIREFDLVRIYFKDNVVFIEKVVQEKPQRTS